MSDVTEVQCWPCTTQAIDWSADGIIALAAEDNLALLFPSTHTPGEERQPEHLAWNRAPLHASYFSKDELPDKAPAPVKTYSVGEEISQSFPVQIAWSSPGLAKYRGCALAVLTSNLVLSLWACDGKPQEVACWARRLIVNDALRSYFSSDAAENEDSVVVTDAAERLRLRTRLRAFAWAPDLPQVDELKMFGTQMSWGPYLVAVSNDDNQVIIVRIDSPTSTFQTEDSWKAEILRHFIVTPSKDRVFDDPVIFDELVSQQRFISSLVWSPWIRKGNEFQSVLAYAASEELRLRIITLEGVELRVGEEIVYPNIVIRHKGYMTWSSQVSEGNKLTLAVFSYNTINFLSVAAFDGSILVRLEHTLGDRWDEVSGTVWDHPTASVPPLLHFSTLQSTMQEVPAVLKVCVEDISAQSHPGWRERINDAQALFSARYDLKGHVRVKVWGLSASPLKDYIVVSHTMHPSDMIEYGPPVDRRTTVAISSFSSRADRALALTDRTVSAEGLAFTISKWHQDTVENPDGLAKFIKDTAEQLSKIYASHKNATTTTSPLESLNELVGMFKRQVFLDPEMVTSRCSILASTVCLPSASNLLQRTLIAYRLAISTPIITSLLSSDSIAFDADIANSHQDVVTLIAAVLDDTDIPNSQHASPITAARPSNPRTACTFCKSALPFTDFRTATCANGHQFPRCGLTFLPIQAPRITKYCGLCETPFLSEEYVAKEHEMLLIRNDTAVDVDVDVEVQGPAQNDMNVGDTAQPKGFEGEDATVDVPTRRKELQPLSLANVLFYACDVCIYCGGKFIMS